MTTIPQLPAAPTVGSGDLVPLSQGGNLYAATVGQLTAGLQTEILVPTGDVLGRVSAGAGAPEALGLGAGLALSATTLAATGTDHLAFPLLDTFSSGDEVIVNATGAPARLPVAELRSLFVAGTGIDIDPGGTLSVTASAIAGPAGPRGPAGPAGAQGSVGPAGPQGAGLAAPGSANTASTIAVGDCVAIWQNGANAWITYGQLIGGQTIDQLPAAGPAADSDLLLVAQDGNALSSQSFAAIWNYVARKIPAVRHGVVELTVDTVLDATTHNRRILVASQPLTLSANFVNMGSGFSCRVINLSAGAVVMGTGIVSGSGATILASGAEAELMALSYSGGSVVWWGGGGPAAPTITVDAIGSPEAGTAFAVDGRLFDETPTALDYSTDGTTWTAAVSPVISAGGYQFQMPGLAAGTYTLKVRDHENPSVVGVGPAFSVTAAPDVSYTIDQPSTTTYAAGSGTVALNGGISPAQAVATQVALSTSNTVTPASGWQTASIIDNNTLWAAYATIPAAAGSYYVWVETASGTSPAVSGFTITVT